MPVRQDFLLLGIGELLWDCFGDERKPGGAPANVAFHASQLGMNSIVASRVGCDAMGDELRSFLQDSGLDTAYIQTDSKHPTGTVTVEMTRPDHPEYTIHENVAWDHIQFDERLERACAKADAICFGTLAQRSPESRATIQKSIESASNALIVYDVNLRAPFYDRPTIEASLRNCHIAKFNDHESKVLVELLGLNASDLDAVAAALRAKYELKAVCITRGAKGCLIQTADDSANVESKPITVADTVGAGDAFTAAITFAFLNQWSAASTGSFANQFAAQIASRPGAMPTLDPADTQDLVAKASRRPSYP